jgi:hypothetical protein
MQHITRNNLTERDWRMFEDELIEGNTPGHCERRIDCDKNQTGWVWSAAQRAWIAVCRLCAEEYMTSLYVREHGGCYIDFREVMLRACPVNTEVPGWYLSVSRNESGQIQVHPGSASLGSSQSEAEWVPPLGVVLQELAASQTDRQ